jgi:hypothetical protein
VAEPPSPFKEYPGTRMNHAKGAGNVKQTPLVDDEEAFVAFEKRLTGGTSRLRLPIRARKG